jgi:hypothetical protein
MPRRGVIFQLWNEGMVRSSEATLNGREYPSIQIIHPLSFPREYAMNRHGADDTLRHP